MTVKYRLMSDLHLEFANLDVPVLPDENEMVLVLAGDVAVASYDETYVKFITEMCDRHDTVIWIMGNHEYYKNYIEEAMDEIKGNFVPRPNNLLILESGCVVVKDVAFICATLWTDYNKEDPMCMNASRQYMNDHRLIYKNGPSASPYSGYNPTFLPEDALAIHRKHRREIFEHAEQLDIRAKVLVTHHGFCEMSIADAFKEEKDLNGAFISEMFDEIYDAGFDYAHHGHSHYSFDYMIGDTHVITNPRGYNQKGTDENSRFDASLVLEV
jgi:predicted phosphodiesterase